MPVSQRARIMTATTARAVFSGSRRRFLTGLACAGTLSITGCGLRDWAHNGFKVGPEYARPDAPVAEQWIDQADPRIATTPAQLADWWTTLRDPVLDQLIQESHLQNLTLREAGARVLEARYLRTFTAGTLFPQAQAISGAYTRNKQSPARANLPPTIQQWYDDWNVGIGTSWEIDFWGRYRRAVEDADAQLDATIENYDDVLVVLLADVASTYIEMRTYQQRLRYALDNVAAQEKLLATTEFQLREGATNERDVQQARTVLEQTSALVPQMEAGVRRASNRLCMLLGMPPRDLAAELGPAPIPKVPPQIALGIPADLVRRRPDIRRAERELAAQSARIGVAVSDLYPHMGLNGSIGVAAEEFGGLFGGSTSLVGVAGPFVRWDILHYGRLASRIGIQDARFEQLAWSYQQQVVNAGREAEDAVITFLKSQERVRHIEASTQAATKTLELATKQYLEGLVDYTTVYLFSADLATRQDELAVSYGTVAQSLVAVYRALGGGWEIRLNPTATNVSPLPPVTPEPANESPEPAASEPAPSAPTPSAPTPPDAAPGT